MHIDGWIVLAGLIVGFVVGLTGMGGGALMTPVLVLFFGVQPLAAVSSDLVASLVMKPVGSIVHARRGTVDRDLVKWLVLGSVPSAFCGVLLLHSFGSGQQLQSDVKLFLGIALLVASAALVAKAYLNLRHLRAHAQAGTDAAEVERMPVRPLPTLLIGVLGGLVVGMTSVGSGSIIIVLLLVLYPRLTVNRLVGTDLVQAVPLVGAAVAGHLLFGSVQLGLTASLLIGSLPGVYLGARVSSVAPGFVVRRALTFVLLASALKLLDVSTATLAWVLGAALVVGPIAWMAVRATHGLGYTNGRLRGLTNRRQPASADGELIAA